MTQLLEIPRRQVIMCASDAEMTSCLSVIEIACHKQQPSEHVLQPIWLMLPAMRTRAHTPAGARSVRYGGFWVYPCADDSSACSGNKGF